MPPEADTAPVPQPLAGLTHLLDGTKYRVLGLLGKGAQGFVVDAEHVALGKAVVVKVLHERHVLDAIQVERMRVEAQALARLTSIHLVPVIDLGTLADGRPYFVMEKLAGRTLHAEGRARGPLPPGEAIEIARQVLAALSVVHRAGLVHRDVKPANVFLSATETPGAWLVKLLDFGVAKVLPATGAVVNAPAPTVGGIAIGTPKFLSPEQACANPVDARSDVYSVGALLFWMLSGRDPFAHHKGMIDILTAHVTEPAPLVSDVAPCPVPRALELAIHKALQKLPEQRYATAKDFADALSAVPLDQAMVRASNGGTIRMGGPLRPFPSSEPMKRPPAGGGTVRMVQGAGHARDACAQPERASRSPPRPAFARGGAARPVVSSLGLAVLVAVAFASLTVLLLLGVRLAGVLR